MSTISRSLGLSKKRAVEHALTATASTMFEGSDEQGGELVFRIIDSNGNGQPAGTPALAAPTPMPVAIPAEVGADSMVTAVVGGVKVVSMHFSIPGPALKYMD